MICCYPLSRDDPVGKKPGASSKKKAEREGIASGNMLGSEAVLSAMAEAAAKSDQNFELRLLDSLKSAHDAGSDFRGLLSAALLILHPDRPPLTLRIDYHADDPIGALEYLYRKATSGDYAEWAQQVPVASDKGRVLD